MLAKFVKWISVSLLVLAVLWPSPAGYRILPAAFVVCAAVLLAAQTSRPGKYFWEAAHTKVAHEVKYEN